jgi:GNAT superfamily N-acetyltransferase
LSEPERGVEETLAFFEGAGSLFALDLGRASDDPLPSDARPRRATIADADVLQAAMEAAGIYPPDDARRRLEVGRRAYVMEVGGDVAAYGWVADTDEPLGNSGFVFAPAPGDVWLYDFATLPAYRGRRHYPVLLRFIARDLAESGFRRAWIGTAPGNIASQRGILRAGFRPVVAVRFDSVAVPPDIQMTPVPGASRDMVAAAARVHARAG